MPRSGPAPLLARCVAVLLLALSQAANAEEAFAYRQPPEALRAVLDATPLPNVSVDPTGQTLAIVVPQRYPRIAALSRPFLRLAGLRVDPAANGPHRFVRIERLSLRALAPGADEKHVALPPEGDFHGLSFSPDGKRFVLLRRMANSTELWSGDTASGKAGQVSGIALQAVGGSPVVWIDGHTLIARTIAPGRGGAPKLGAPAGPVVRESFGKRSPEPTFQDLLRSAHDEALYAYYFTSTLTRIDLATNQRRVIAAPAIQHSVSVIGDGRHLLVQRIVPPFSYAVPQDEFGREVEIVDRDGKTVRVLGRVALRENVPVQGVITGPRRYIASALSNGVVYWFEALDGGDPRKKVPHRDRVMSLAPPYTGDPVELVRTGQRASGFVQLDDGRLFITDFDRDRVWLRTLVVDAAKPGAEPFVLFDLSARDRYRNPGAPLTRVLANGRSVVQVDGDRFLTHGRGASPEGDRPFLDRWTIATRTKERLFESDRDHDEEPVVALDATGARYVTWRQGASEPPNAVLHEGGAARALTQFADPAPQVRAVKRELVKFRRKDGVEQSFWLYRPPDMKPGERRPALLWAYPMEYTDPELAGQVSGSRNRFEQFIGPNSLFLALDGYVVLQDVTMPVVGTPETVNDTFIDQIRMNAAAAIAKADEMGVIDPSRVAVGGHSYGAFMTANLLAHTDFFKAGIARSGAYNRTLTPFGFQAERRTLWEAPDAYLKLSPFIVADKLKAPILLIHGEADDNTGTYPEQSDRLFAALAGTGGNARLVKLPAEAHAYLARESVGHVLWEMSSWLHKHLGEPR